MLQTDHESVKIHSIKYKVRMEAENLMNKYRLARMSAVDAEDCNRRNKREKERSVELAEVRKRRLCKSKRRRGVMYR